MEGGGHLLGLLLGDVSLGAVAGQEEVLSVEGLVNGQGSAIGGPGSWSPLQPGLDAKGMGPFLQELQVRRGGFSSRFLQLWGASRTEGGQESGLGGPGAGLRRFFRGSGGRGF